jgi:hypothetical protein
MVKTCQCKNPTLESNMCKTYCQKCSLTYEPIEEKCIEDVWQREKEDDELVKETLIEILAKCETAEDARACRHIIKDYILGL